MKTSSNVQEAVWLRHFPSPPLEHALLDSVAERFYKTWRSSRSLRTTWPFRMIYKQMHKQHVRHSCLSNALESAGGTLISKESNSQEEAETEQFGIAKFADWWTKNKLRLPGITWYVFGALKRMVKIAWFNIAQAIALPNKVLRKKRLCSPPCKRMWNPRCIIEILEEQKDSSNV